MKKKDVEPIFDKVSEDLDYVSQVDGFVSDSFKEVKPEEDRYQIDREITENDSTELIDLRYSNDKIDIYVTQERLIIKNTNSKGIKEIKDLFADIQNEVKKHNCNAEIRDDYDGIPHILSIECSKSEKTNLEKDEIIDKIEEISSSLSDEIRNILDED